MWQLYCERSPWRQNEFNYSYGNWHEQAHVHQKQTSEKTSNHILHLLARCTYGPTQLANNQSLEVPSSVILTRFQARQLPGRAV